MARPLSYDRDAVLDDARKTFWKQGYNATSINNLVDVMGIPPCSIYIAFGNKRTLLEEALDADVKCVQEKINRVFSAVSSPIVGLRNLLERIVEEIYTDTELKGCLLTNIMAELARTDSHIRGVTNTHCAKLEAMFESTILQGQAKGEIEESKNAKILSIYYMTTIWGIKALSSRGYGKEELLGIVDNTMQAFIAAPKSRQ